MALSGSVSTNAGEDGRYYKLSWTATQSIANNTSTISWTLEAKVVGQQKERSTLTSMVLASTVSLHIQNDTLERQQAAQRLLATIVMELDPLALAWALLYITAQSLALVQIHSRLIQSPASLI